MSSPALLRAEESELERTEPRLRPAQILLNQSNYSVS